MAREEDEADAAGFPALALTQTRKWFQANRSGSELLEPQAPPLHPS